MTKNCNKRDFYQRANALKKSMLNQQNLPLKAQILNRWRHFKHEVFRFSYDGIPDYLFKKLIVASETKIKTNTKTQYSVRFRTC